MGDVAGLAQAAIGSQNAMTADAVAVSMMKQQLAIEQQLVDMIAQAAQQALLPPGQGRSLDISI